MFSVLGISMPSPIGATSTAPRTGQYYSDAAEADDFGCEVGCPHCWEPMKLVRTISHVPGIPEILAFYCSHCEHAETSAAGGVGNHAARSCNPANPSRRSRPPAGQ